MTKLKVVAILALLLASPSAFARGGGGGMSHGDHMTMNHNDQPTTTHGQGGAGAGKIRLHAHRTIELQRIEARIRIVGGQLVKLVNMGQQNSVQFKVLARQLAVLNAKLARFGLPPVMVGLNT